MYLSSTLAAFDVAAAVVAADAAADAAAAVAEAAAVGAGDSVAVVAAVVVDSFPSGVSLEVHGFEGCLWEAPCRRCIEGFEEMTPFFPSPAARCPSPEARTNRSFGCQRKT